MYSKDSYNYGRHGRKRRLKSIPVIITLLVVILILGGIYFLLFNEKNKYEDYNTYNETNKQYGTVQHYEKENDDFYISLYYPKLKEKNLNKIIKESYSTYLKSEKKKKTAESSSDPVDHSVYSETTSGTVRAEREGY